MPRISFPDIDATSQQREQLFVKVQQLLDDDMPAKAAKLLWKSADTYAQPDAGDFRLRAISILFAARNPLKARLYLSRFPEDDLNARQLVEKRLYGAHFMMQTKRPDKVLSNLTLAMIEDATPQIKVRAYRLIADAATQTGDIVRVIRSHLALTELLPEDQISDNTLSLWRALANTPPTEAIMQTTHADKRMRAWLELAQLASPKRTDIPRLETEFAAWKTRNTWIQPLSVIEQELRQRWQYLNFKPKQIALLLPLTGAYGEFGQSVKTGFMRLYEASSPTFALRVYNTDQERDIVELYQQAVADGAGLIIGPLLSEQLAKLIEANAISVATLSLNYYNKANISLPNDHIQFGLLPEDEAIQVARKMWDNRHHYAVILTPNDDWGDRLAQNFIREYTRLGGVVRETLKYNPALIDHSTEIKALLHVDESVARHRRVQDVLGEKVRATPRIRQDVQAAVLFADAEHAKQIYPQIKYHYADTLPIYATSHIYSPQQPIKRELDGLIYCDIPFLLSGQSENITLPRLYALGMDAYRLIDSFRLMQISQIRISGQTGTLSSTHGRRIFRTLYWAKFEQGQPLPLQPLN